MTKITTSSKQRHKGDGKTVPLLLIASDIEESWVEVTDDGQTRSKRIIYATVPVVEHYNCFCCSCDGTDEGMVITDPACRNHGYGFGTRPCDVHHTSGTPWSEEVSLTLAGKMPVSVQKHAEARKDATGFVIREEEGIAARDAEEALTATAEEAD